MYRKPSVKRIIELLDKGLSEREIARSLHASHNTVAVVKDRLSRCQTPMADLISLSAGELFFPDRFTGQDDYAQVHYGCIFPMRSSYMLHRRGLWKRHLFLDQM